MLVTAASTALGYSFDVLNRLSSALNDLARSQNQIVLAALLLIVLAASMTWLGITGGRKRMDVVGKVGFSFTTFVRLVCAAQMDRPSPMP